VGILCLSFDVLSNILDEGNKNKNLITLLAFILMEHFFLTLTYGICNAIPFPYIVKKNNEHHKSVRDKFEHSMNTEYKEKLSTKKFVIERMKYHDDIISEEF